MVLEDVHLINRCIKLLGGSNVEGEMFSNARSTFIRFSKYADSVAIIVVVSQSSNGLTQVIHV